MKNKPKLPKMPMKPMMPPKKNSSMEMNPAMDKKIDDFVPKKSPLLKKPGKSYMGL